MMQLTDTDACRTDNNCVIRIMQNDPTDAQVAGVERMKHTSCSDYQ